jgi:hypothetical protein
VCLCLHDAVGREGTAGRGFSQLITEHHVFRNLGRTEIEPPAKTEVAVDFRAAVIGADNLNRQTRNGNRQIVEGNGEVADF